jgi:teichuronic acid biosynthesis glycosyltransferase TuaG
VIVDLPVNVGAAQARNEGIQRARGRFIAFLDSDDMWLSEKLRIQRRYIDDHPECSLVHSSAWAFYEQKPDLLCACHWDPPLSLPDALTHDYWVILPTMLLRTDVIRALGGFDPDFRGSEDHEFVIRCRAAGYRIDGIREPLARFRRENQERLTSRQWWLYLTHMRLCWKHRALYYRIYGARGILSFLLSSLLIATATTRYVGGGVRLLLRFITIKYRVKPDYREHVEFGVIQMSNRWTSA